jgi:hypothetical protein
VHALPVDAAEAARIAADEDILGHRQIGTQIDFLVDRADAQRLRLQRGGRRNGAAIQFDLA